MKFLCGAILLVLVLATVPLRAQAITSRYQEPYPSAASKKGLQVEMVDDALALGVKHAALNFNLTQLIDLKEETNNPAWTMNGGTYRFRRSQLEAMDRRIQQLSEAGAIVNLIVLTYQSGDPARDRIMIHPG